MICKKTRRYGNYPAFGESTSEHTFKLILMVDYFYKELKLDLDYEKCIRLSIYHDFGEMDLDKDVDIKENTNSDVKKYKDTYELEKIQELSEKYYQPIKEYYHEYKDKKSQEALFVNACDKLESVFHPLTVDKAVMNHELFAVFADKAVKNYPMLMPIYREVKKLIKERYEKWGFEWKEEYDAVFVDTKENV